ncbi:MAG: uracil-DNA glycosylase family protein, partial [Chloroflexota bacterium]
MVRTLPDLLRPGLDLVFVGINPGEESARRGHYYAHPGNAFWPALSASGLTTRPVTTED